MPVTERLRIAHPGAAMLTVAAPSGAGCTPAAVKDGGVGPKGGAQVAADLIGNPVAQAAESSHAELDVLCPVACAVPNGLPTPVADEWSGEADPLHIRELGNGWHRVRH